MTEGESAAPRRMAPNPNCPRVMSRTDHGPIRCGLDLPCPMHGVADPESASPACLHTNVMRMEDGFICRDCRHDLGWTPLNAPRPAESASTLERLRGQWERFGVVGPTGATGAYLNALEAAHGAALADVVRLRAEREQLLDELERQANRSRRIQDALHAESESSRRHAADASATAAKWFARASVSDAALDQLVRACEAMEGLAADAVDMDTKPGDMPTAPPLFDQFEVAMLAARAVLAAAPPEVKDG